MNPPFLRITLSLGSRTRDVAIDAMAEALRSSDPYPALVKLLLDPNPQLMNKGRETTESGVLSLPATVNDDKDLLPNSFSTVTVRNRRESRGRERVELVDDSEALAAFLAERLHDWRSLGFYRKVARMLPESVVRDALTRALDVPAHAIRRSRGAYFTTLIVKSLPTARQSFRSNSSTPSYDPPIPSAP